MKPAVAIRRCGERGQIPRICALQYLTPSLLCICRPSTPPDAMPNLKAVHLLPRRFSYPARCHLLPAAGFFVPEQRSPRKLCRNNRQARSWAADFATILNVFCCHCLSRCPEVLIAGLNASSLTCCWWSRPSASPLTIGIPGLLETLLVAPAFSATVNDWHRRE